MLGSIDLEMGFLNEEKRSWKREERENPSCEWMGSGMEKGNENVRGRREKHKGGSLVAHALLDLVLL